MCVCVFGISELKPELVGCEGVAYEYQAPCESDDEMEDLVQDLWGLDVQSDEDEDARFDDTDSEDGSVPDSPPPDDAQSM